jgi:hypothetical protein
MAHPDLIHYIQQSQPQFTTEQIRHVLVSAGWNAADVDEALLEVAANTPKPTKPKSRVPLLLAILVAVIAAGALFAMSSNRKLAQRTSLLKATPSPSPSTAALLPSPSPTQGPLLPGWKTYTTTLAVPQFSFEYPAGWNVSTETVSQGVESFYIEEGTDTSKQFLVVTIHGPSDGLATYNKKKDGTFYTTSAALPFTLNSSLSMGIAGYSGVQNDFTLGLSGGPSHSLTNDLLVNGNTDISLGFATTNDEASFQQRRAILTDVLSTIRILK